MRRRRAQGAKPRGREPTPPGTRRCLGCREILPLSDFSPNASRCRPCTNAENREKRKAQGRKVYKQYDDPPGFKTCRKCEVRKPQGDFRAEPRNTSDGLQSYCKECNRVDAWLRKGVAVEDIPPPREQPPEGHKRCPSCDELKPFDQFHKNAARADGVDVYCRDCAYEVRWAREAAQAAKEGRRPPRRLLKDDAPPGFRTCTVCNEVKPLDAFYKDKRAPKGVTSACRECRKAAAAKRRKRRGIPERPRYDDPPGHKTCRRCGIRKPVDNFSPEPRNTTDGLRSWCDECQNDRTLEWHRANPAKMNELKAIRREAVEVSTVTEREWCRLLNRFSGCCAYCGNRAKLSMEHVIPLTRGGSHSIGNLLPVCQSCNSSKNNRLLVEWRWGPRQRDRLAINRG